MESIYNQLGQYWVRQPGTSGPVYVGGICNVSVHFRAICCKGPMKWALLAAAVLSVLLSWGKNFYGIYGFLP